MLDGIVLVLRFDRERGPIPAGVVTPELTSNTAGRLTSWKLILGPPAIGGEPRAEILPSIKNLSLMQGIVDSLTPVLDQIRPHWTKLFLVKTADGRLLGDVKVDGIQIGVPPSFDSPRWPQGLGFVVRQFGFARPTSGQVRDDFARTLGADAPASAQKRPWWQRLRG